mmetsp:Transcript_1093/g.2374  ORF Transcript_1093/g.2374 Transcript_1093/m.2374 type:complete len:213 (+) Transcript_1093:2711-3349(+)
MNQVSSWYEPGAWYPAAMPGIQVSRGMSMNLLAGYEPGMDEVWGSQAPDGGQVRLCVAPPGRPAVAVVPGVEGGVVLQQRVLHAFHLPALTIWEAGVEVLLADAARSALLVLRPLVTEVAHEQVATRAHQTLEPLAVGRALTVAKAVQQRNVQHHVKPLASQGRGADVNRICLHPLDLALHALPQALLGLCKHECPGHQVEGSHFPAPAVPC